MNRWINRKIVFQFGFEEILDSVQMSRHLRRSLPSVPCNRYPNVWVVCSVSVILCFPLILYYDVNIYAKSESLWIRIICRRIGRISKLIYQTITQILIVLLHFWPIKGRQSSIGSVVWCNASLSSLKFSNREIESKYIFISSKVHPKRLIFNVFIVWLYLWDNIFISLVFRKLIE